MSYSTSNRGSGGGGGGFGSFPYRSSHQSGSDYPGGRGGGGGGGRKKRSSKSKYLKRKQHGGPLLYTALLSVPSLKRSLIVGHAGKVIKDICHWTNCVMDVPAAARASGGGGHGSGPDPSPAGPAAGSSNDNSSTGTTNSTATNNNSEIAAEGSRRERGRNGNNALARVKIRASCVEYLLFACWEVSLVIQEDVEYQINIQPPQQHQHQQGKYRTGTSTASTSPLITILRGIMRYLPSNLMSSTSSSCNRQDGNVSAEQYSPTCTNDSLSPCNNDNSYSAGLFLEDMHSVVAPTDDTTTSNRDGTIYSIHPIMIMSCYVIPSYLLDEDEMEVLVDNERFCDPDIKALAFTVTRTREEQQHDGGQEKAFVGSGEVLSHSNLTLLFIYGSPNDRTWNLYHNIHKHVRKLEEEEER